MLEYIRRLLLAQTKLAAQFDTAPQPEIREVLLRAEQTREEEQTDLPEADMRSEKKERDEALQSAQGRYAEQMLRDLTRQTMRMQSIRMHETAQQTLAQTKKLELAMTAWQQGGDLTKRTPETGAEDGVTGSYRQSMQFAGIASHPSQRSMQEISRFFERDARRYG